MQVLALHNPPTADSTSSNASSSSRLLPLSSNSPAWELEGLGVPAEQCTSIRVRNLPPGAFTRLLAQFITQIFGAFAMKSCFFSVL
jgi:hypothetical protein